MNLTKFLLIDGGLLLLVLTLLFAYQGQKAKVSLLTNLDTNQIDITNENSINLPSYTKLMELEQIARKEGSGIDYASLIGIWKFESVWRKGTDRENSISSSLLRMFSASLEIKRSQLDNELLKFDIINSIEFGVLSIRFIGSGDVEGSRPLLPFSFERIELKFSKNSLFTRSLDIPDKNNRPFFALIAMESNGKWLAARGRGGGLALWLKGEANKH